MPKSLVSDLRREFFNPGKPWDDCGTGKESEYNCIGDPNPKSPTELLSHSWPLGIMWYTEYLLFCAGILGKTCKTARDN